MTEPDSEERQEESPQAGPQDQPEASEADAEAQDLTAAEADPAALPAEDRPGDAEEVTDPDDDDDAEPMDEGARISELEAERNSWRDQHLRLLAKNDNIRKKTENRLRQESRSAMADLIKHFLEPLDDLLSVSALEGGDAASVEAIVEGVDQIERKFSRALEAAGVGVVDPPEGESFDPNTMEAMMRVATDSEDDDDTVASVFQRGYTLKGMLIRAARVSVFKAD